MLAHAYIGTERHGGGCTHIVPGKSSRAAFENLLQAAEGRDGGRSF
jgi:hypothetical protein